MFIQTIVSWHHMEWHIPNDHLKEDSFKWSFEKRFFLYRSFRITLRRLSYGRFSYGRFPYGRFPYGRFRITLGKENYFLFDHTQNGSFWGNKIRRKLFPVECIFLIIPKMVHFGETKFEGNYFLSNVFFVPSSQNNLLMIIFMSLTQCWKVEFSTSPYVSSLSVIFKLLYFKIFYFFVSWGKICGKTKRFFLYKLEESRVF